MVAYTRNMNQVATYWAPIVNDGFGGKGFAAPILIKCRWENKSNLAVTAQGKELVGIAIVYPDRVLANEGYLALGDQSAQANPRDVASSNEIQFADNVPNLSGTLELNKVALVNRRN